MRKLDLDAVAFAVMGVAGAIGLMVLIIFALISPVRAQTAIGNSVSGAATTTGTSTTSLVPLVTARRLFITSYSCVNTGSTTSLITFQDGSGGTALWYTIVPTGSGANLSAGSGPPLFWTTSGTALYFAAGSASTTVYCAASGHS